MRNLAVAVAGCNNLPVIAAWSRTQEGAPAALYDEDPLRAAAAAGQLEDAAAFASLPDMLALQPYDIVHVCLPPQQQYEAVSMALQSGAHVVCELPVTGSLQQARKLQQMAAECGRFLMPAFTTRFHPLMRRALERLQADDYGIPALFHCRLGLNLPSGVSPKTGAALQTALYGIDMFRACCGEALGAVAAEQTSSPLLQVEDTVVVLLKGKHTLGVVEALWSSIDPHSSLQLTGSAGAFHLDFDGETLRSKTADWQEWRIEQAGGSPPLMAFLQHAAAVVQNREAPETAASDVIRALELCLGRT